MRKSQKIYKIIDCKQLDSPTNYLCSSCFRRCRQFESVANKSVETFCWHLEMQETMNDENLKFPQNFSIHCKL